MLAFTVFVSIASGVLFGLTPALHSLRASHTRALRDLDRSATAGVVREEAQGALNRGGDCALADAAGRRGAAAPQLLPAAAGGRGVPRRPRRSLTMRLSPNQARFNRPKDSNLDSARRGSTTIRCRARAPEPGVESATLSEALRRPTGPTRRGARLLLEGQSPAEAMGIPPCHPVGVGGVHAHAGRAAAARAMVRRGGYGGVAL